MPVGVEAVKGTDPGGLLTQGGVSTDGPQSPRQVHSRPQLEPPGPTRGGTPQPCGCVRGDGLEQTWRYDHQREPLTHL